MSFNSLMDDIEKRMDEIRIEQLEEEITEKSKNLSCEKCGEKTYSVDNFSKDGDAITGHLKCMKCGFEFDMKKNL